MIQIFNITGHSANNDEPFMDYSMQASAAVDKGDFSNNNLVIITPSNWINDHHATGADKLMDSTFRTIASNFCWNKIQQQPDTGSFSDMLILYRPM